MNGPRVAKTVCIVVALYVVAAISSPAQSTFTTLASFDVIDGSEPLYMSLVQGPDASLYGTTLHGGTVASCTGGLSCGLGTVFKITPSGTLTTLHSFDSQPLGADGFNPFAGLVLGTDGNLYGVATYGGDCGGAGAFAGTVFKITPSGTLTTLYTFCSPTDGFRPDGALTQATDGNFYGTTYEGGSTYQGNICPAGCGTVFKIAPSGTFTTLYSFCSQPNCADGGQPMAALVEGTDGNFYGTTTGGGANGGGTVFKITATGTLTTLYSFCSQPYCADGFQPEAALVEGTDGNFYGTTVYSAYSDNCFLGCGTIFKINPGGTLTTLYTFCSQPACADGLLPYAGLIQATDGNFYGMTYTGGTGTSTSPSLNCATGCGTAFKITPGGTLTTLYSFCSQTNCTDGGGPIAAPVQASDGNLYGTTPVGGASGYGTVFSLSLGLAPPDFSLAAASASLSVQPGSQTTDVITVATQSGTFSSAVQLSCAVTGSTSPVACSLSPTSVRPGAGSVTSTLTISAATQPAQFASSTVYGAVILLPLALLGFSFGSSRSKGRERHIWLLCSLLFAFAALQAACGGGSAKQMQTQNYTVTIAGSSGAIMHTAQVTVTVP